MTLWERAIDQLLLAEGGYVNDPKDPGGETKFGISKRSYPHLDIAGLTREEAIQIYRRDYWDPIPAYLSDGMRWMVFDSAVNHGLPTALGWLKDYPDLLGYAGKRLAFYALLPHFDRFGRGWTRRVGLLLNDISDWYAELPASRAETVVFNGFGPEPIVIRGDFRWRARGPKIDIKRAAPAEE